MTNSTQEPAEGGEGTPPPLKGSPRPDKGPDGDNGPDSERYKRSTEKAKDFNPLAPPINIGAGS